MELPLVMVGIALQVADVATISVELVEVHLKKWVLNQLINLG